MSEPLLVVEDLEVSFGLEGGGEVAALRGVTLEVGRGETLGLVGESGSGKSLTALASLRLLPASARITGGEVRLEGEDVLGASEDRLRAMRGGVAAIVFQDAMAALNPVVTVGRQIEEVLEEHRRMKRREARIRATELLREVGIPEAAKRMKQYPHQLSGGLRQRAMIAMAIAGDPVLLIADEPTTALDVTIQRQVLSLLRREQRRRGMAVVFITHELGLVAGLADRVAVLYAGRVVEEAATTEIFANPRHPYTRALLAATPRVNDENFRAVPIAGAAPELGELEEGCSFSPRCSLADERCFADQPRRVRTAVGIVECWKAE